MKFKIIKHTNEFELMDGENSVCTIHEIDSKYVDLIASAPNMLQDLERALSVLISLKKGEPWDSECDFHTKCVIETIKKAKGEI